MVARAVEGQRRRRLRRLTFEVRRDRRYWARPARRMIDAWAARAWPNAVGPRLDRGVRPRLAGTDVAALGSKTAPALSSHDVRARRTDRLFQLRPLRRAMELAPAVPMNARRELAGEGKP